MVADDGGLLALYQKNKLLPNGGARLMVVKPIDQLQWTVTDGMWRYGRWNSKRAANAQLRKAGFISHAFLNGKEVYWHTA